MYVLQLTDFNRKSHRKKCAPLRTEYYVKKYTFYLFRLKEKKENRFNRNK